MNLPWCKCSDSLISKAFEPNVDNADPPVDGAAEGSTCMPSSENKYA